jgi:hypothetical protein
MIKSNGIISRVVRKMEVKDTNSVVDDVERLQVEQQFFLAVKETCNVTGLSGVHGKFYKSKTYWPVKWEREAWVVSEKSHRL